MSILTRYIARQYLTNILVLLVLLCGFVVMVDVSVNLSRFARAAERAGAESSAAEGTGGQPAGGFLTTGWRTVVVVADLWWPRLLQLYNYLIGLVLVGAMGFTFTQLARHRELVAMLAGGVSLFRAARPVLVVALGCTLLQVVNQEFILPRIAPLLTRDAGEAGARESSSFPLKLTPDSQGRVFQAHRFHPSTGRIEGVNVWLRDETGRAESRVSAAGAQYDGSAWVLEEARLVPLTIGGRAAPAPASIKSDLDPTTILAGHYAAYNTTLSWRQIALVLAAPTLKKGLRDDLTRIGYGRVSAIICSLLSLVIALPFFLNREPENLQLQALKSAPVAILTLLGGVLGTSMAVPGLPPIISVFIPVLILAPLSVAAVSSIKT